MLQVTPISKASALQRAGGQLPAVLPLLVPVSESLHPADLRRRLADRRPFQCHPGLQAVLAAPPLASASGYTLLGPISTSSRTTRCQKSRSGLGIAFHALLLLLLPLLPLLAAPLACKGSAPHLPPHHSWPAAHQPGQRGAAAQVPGHQRPHQLRLHGPAAHR